MIEKLTNLQAYNDTPANNYSKLKNALGDVEDYAFWLENKKKKSKSLSNGKAFHALLEQEYSVNTAYNDGFLELDESIFGDSLLDENFRRKKEYQEWKKNALDMAKLQGKELCDTIPREMLDANKALFDSAIKGKGFSFEVAIQDIESNTKGIIDLVRIDGNCAKVIDVKTSSVEFLGEKYGRHNALKIIFDYDYDLQAYMYCELAKKFYDVSECRYFWMFAGTEKPYKVGVFECSTALLQSGKEKYNLAISNIAKWEKTGFKRTELEIITL